MAPLPDAISGVMMVKKHLEIVFIYIIVGIAGSRGRPM
jgi:hypothetical protein